MSVCKSTVSPDILSMKRVVHIYELHMRTCIVREPLVVQEYVSVDRQLAHFPHVLQPVGDVESVQRHIHGETL